MLSPTRLYYLKKWYSIYPGILRPVSASFLADYYVQRQAKRSLARRLLDAIVGSAFKLWVPLRARSVARKFGLGAEWRRNAVRIAHQRFADPNDLALFRIKAPEEMDHFMRRFEYAGISKRINPMGWRSDCAMTDKLKFRARCLEHGLPHPPLLATVAAGAVEIIGLPRDRTLAVKPLDGEGGRGFRLISFPEWEEADEADFSALLARELGREQGTWLVQPRLSNHPAMREISLNALSTVRMTTIRSETGQPEVVTSVLRFPSTRASLVDNLKAGGLMAPVDPQTGLLGPGCRGRAVGELPKHPETGAAIGGRQLPFWAEARELVLRAHAEGFPEYLMVGWDVVITETGPLLLEGQGKPSLIMAQRATGKGIGETRFGELIAYHLRQAG